MRNRLEILILSTHPILVGFVGVVLILAVVILGIAFIEVFITLFLLAAVGGFSFMLGEWIKEKVGAKKDIRMQNAKQM